MFSTATTQEHPMSDIPAARQRPNFLQFLGRFENGELVEKLTRELEEERVIEFATREGWPMRKKSREQRETP